MCAVRSSLYQIVKKPNKKQATKECLIEIKKTHKYKPREKQIYDVAYQKSKGINCDLVI